jgi:thiol-disulfide isomerase/thioredoxin
MSKASRARRPRAEGDGRVKARQKGRPSGGADRRSRWWIPAIAGAVVVAAAIAAVALSGPSPRAFDATSTRPPVAAASRVAGATTLPQFTGGVDDPAVGRVIPAITGSSFDGSSVAIATNGRPKLLLFLAHWCPHCQREVPVVQSWIDAGRLPADVEIVSVATSNDPARPNYPPEAWLAREHWTSPVLVDADGAAAWAYGLDAFPYWVAVDANNRVVSRVTGELSPGQLDALVASVRS